MLAVLPAAAVTLEITPAVAVGPASPELIGLATVDRLLDTDNIGDMFANIEKISYRKNF